MSEIKLYDACMTVSEFRGYKNVCFILWAEKRGNPGVDYRHAIQGFDAIEENLRAYPMDAINELFTESEVGLLRQLVENVWGEKFEFHHVELPIPSNWAGGGSIPYGGLTGRVDLSVADDYNLPFKVCGYYDLRHCELVYGMPEKGTEFAKALACRLKLSLPQTDAELLEVIRDIYDATGLYAELGKTKAEREAEAKRERERAEFKRTLDEDSDLPF